MKIVFLLALLANIFFFFWEYNSTSPNLQSNLSHSDNAAEKEILLVSEVNDAPENKKLIESSELAVIQSSETVSQLESTGVESIEEKVKSQELDIEKGTMETSGQIVNSADEKIVTDLKELTEDDQLIKQVSEGNNNDFSEKNNLADLTDNRKKNDKDISKKLVFCYRVGPFENNDKLEAWRKKNNINEGSLQSFSKDNQADDARYLVYFPAATDYEVSKKNVNLFIDMGITDYWLFKTGNLKGAISLGLFDQADDALALKEKFSKKGVNVEIRESYSNASAFFARVFSIDEDFKETAKMSAEQMVVECKE